MPGWVSVHVMVHVECVCAWLGVCVRDGSCRVSVCLAG